MRHLDDAMIDAAITPAEAQDTLAAAFLAFGQGKAAMQGRVRTDAGGVKLSTLGAVIPDQQVVGAKVYTTIAGQFRFVILLFSARDGRPLATLDAAALTRRRTAACTVLAAGRLAPAAPRVLGLFGAGTQGREHVAQLCARFDFEQVLVNDPHADAAMPERLAQACGVPVALAEPRALAAQADVLVTASRAATPLFAGDALKPGAFVAAIGSSLPTTRELDDRALARARAIVVEWREQTLAEAGDLVLADPLCGVVGKIAQLDEVLAGAPLRQSAQDILIYKSVGVGLEDIALAGLAYRRVAEQEGWDAP
ncbi:ornithine cyclodeaminase family protein [Bordetella genomosp. 1]|uniref:Ornithine cyclodeaminase n=1 Tax=Bordetella genomosp. 1 TaxID=1395607 RepID=A0ABX4F4P2_9BORD|nr:ornithine cyclodeaminase family protein [Bordetella genomosp. 1]OZI68720.1 ornithine cyclodeaminase [Bordetella genomosp. 1]